MSVSCQQRKSHLHELSKEKPPERRLSIQTRLSCDYLVIILDWAASNAGLDFRRYAMKPRPAKPRSIIAHVEGSGTDATGPSTGIENVPPLLSCKVASASGFAKSVAFVKSYRLALKVPPVRSSLPKEKVIWLPSDVRLALVGTGQVCPWVANSGRRSALVSYLAATYSKSPETAGWVGQLVRVLARRNGWIQAAEVSFTPPPLPSHTLRSASASSPVLPRRSDARQRSRRNRLWWLSF
jgi:hypothetical protein